MIVYFQYSRSVYASGTNSNYNVNRTFADNARGLRGSRWALDRIRQWTRRQCGQHHHADCPKPVRPRPWPFSSSKVLQSLVKHRYHLYHAHHNLRLCLNLLICIPNLTTLLHLHLPKLSTHNICMPNNINTSTSISIKISIQLTPTMQSTAQDPCGASKNTRSRTSRHGASVTAAQQHTIPPAAPYGSVPQTGAWSI